MGRFKYVVIWALTCFTILSFYSCKPQKSAPETSFSPSFQIDRSTLPKLSQGDIISAISHIENGVSNPEEEFERALTMFKEVWAEDPEWSGKIVQAEAGVLEVRNLKSTDQNADSLRLTGLRMSENGGIKFEEIEWNNLSVRGNIKFGYLKFVPPKTEKFWNLADEILDYLLGDSRNLPTAAQITEAGIGHYVAKDISFYLGGEYQIDFVGWTSSEDGKTVSGLVESARFNGKGIANSLKYFSITDFELASFPTLLDSLIDFRPVIGTGMEIVNPFHTSFRALSISDLNMSGVFMNERLDSLDVWTTGSASEPFEKNVILNAYKILKPKDKRVEERYRRYLIPRAGYFLGTEFLDPDSLEINYASRALLDQNRDSWIEEIYLDVPNMISAENRLNLSGYNQFYQHSLHPTREQKNSSNKPELFKVADFYLALSDEGYIEKRNAFLEEQSDHRDPVSMVDYFLYMRPYARSEANTEFTMKLQTNYRNSIDNWFEKGGRISVAMNPSEPVSFELMMKGKKSMDKFFRDLNISIEYQN